MRTLFVSAELGELFLGGLLAVARADGVVTSEEMEALRASAAELGLGMPAEEDLLLADEVTGERLAAASRGASLAYRAEASTPDEFGQAFLEAALRVALADHQLVVEEVMILRDFAAALGIPTEPIAGWQVVRRCELA